MFENLANKLKQFTQEKKYLPKIKYFSIWLFVEIQYFLRIYKYLHNIFSEI